MKKMLKSVSECCVHVLQKHLINMTIEISFPRGGRKPPPNAKPQNIQRENDLFGNKRKKQINKHARKSNLFQEKDDSTKAETLHVEQLSTNTIQEGMVLLGCVKNIQKVALEISLPGRLWGKVFVNSISKAYTKLLQTVVDESATDEYKELNALFTLGQCVAVKVLNLNDERFGIVLSMMPQQVNSNISHTNVKTGMTLWGTISEVEDHGYVVDFGINNCRAFLKKDNCDINKDYTVGQLSWFAVIKADISSTATTLTLSAKKEKIRNIKILDGISLDHLLPGMQLDFTISEVLSNGLEGKFFNDYTGYIDIGQLNQSIHHNAYSVDNIIQARILYTMPVTKIAYFTLKPLERHKKERIRSGEIMKCKIQGVTPVGIYINLVTGNSKGFVPMHRARKNIPENESRSDFFYLKRQYRKSTSHECRVLNYDYFEQIYICTLEKQLLNKDMIFTLDNVELGQTVSAEIKEIQSNGLLVKIQQVNGFIKNDHICDTVLKNYDNIKARLKVGQTIQARVWVLNKARNVLYLTMRPSLVKTELLLKDYQQAKENQQFLGVVRQITVTGLLVQFFGDVHGWVPKKKMMIGNVKNSDLFCKIGQLVTCTVVKCEKEKLILSLHSLTEITEDVEPELKLGEHVDGSVSHITNEGVHITVKNTDIIAFIPVLYTSKFPKLAPIVAKMFKPGDELSDLVCVSKNDALPTLSLRDSDVNEDNIQNIKNIKRGTILPCSVLTTDNSGVNVEAPIEHFEKPVLIPIENISDDRNISTSSLKLNQQMYAKVLNVGKNFKTVTASTKLSDVWDYDIQSSVKYFSDYLKEVLRIREYFKSLKNPLACLNLGELVSGVVKSINNDNSCVLELENGARAVVQSEHSKENLSVKDKVEGVVLFWNFEENVAEIALSSKLIPRINHLQHTAIKIPAGVTNKSNAHAEVILVKDDYVLGVLRGVAGKRQLIFIPARLHANDLRPNLSPYVIGDYINIQVNKIENGIIIGLLKQIIRDMNFKWKKHLKYKRQSDNTSEDQPDSKRVKLENPNNEENTKDVKKKDKKNSEFKPDDNISENETETIVKVKRIKNNKDVVDVSNCKKNKTEKKSKISNNEETENVKKERKKKSSISSEEENINIGVEEQKSKKKKEKKRKLDSEDDMSEIITNSEKKKSSISSEEENINIGVEEQKSKKKKEKKRKLDAEDDTYEIIKNNEKMKSSISSEEENINIGVEEQKSKKKKEKKRKLDADDDTYEIIKNSEKMKSSISSEEENMNIVEEQKSKKKKEKKRKLDSEDDTSEIIITNSERKNQKSKKGLTIVDVPDSILPGAENFWNISEEPQNVSEDSSDDEQYEKELRKQQRKAIEDEPAILPGADNFWNIAEEPQNVLEDSSDDDEPDKKELEKQQKKKKMTPAEKAEAARLEEERIRKIELELADAEATPKTVDQFERLVMANPNNSMLWINYMAFHLEATEIEKARIIARKALETIQFREEQEKLNVWIALLNLENRYGAKESFASVLEEAVKMNDSLSVYLQALNILSDSKKTTEFLELLRNVSRKYKQEFKMWTETAEACYKLDLKEEARDLMQRSLKSLDEKQHVNILVQFAFMEARHNEPERAEALLENVLASYPRRVDVWTSYVDMLIKGNRIHIARNVLTRAVGQKLPARKMKTIFSKYIQFETKYGDEENVKKVRQLAAQYVKTALN